MLTYGSGGNGTSSHLAAEMFKAQAGIDLLHVPFRSTTPAETALVAGLTTAGATAITATAAVLVYRVISCWLIIPAGGVAALTLRR